MSDDTLRSVITAYRVNQVSADRSRFAGLMIAGGIASRYSSGAIKEDQARRDFESLLGSGLIRDPQTLTGLTNALRGSVSSAEYERYRDLGRSYYNSVGAIVGLKLPYAGVAISLLGEWAPSIAEYAADPDNPLAPFPLPRPDPVLAAGAFAMNALQRQASGQDAASALIREYLPRTGLDISFDSTPEQCLSQLSDSDRAFLSGTIEAVARRSATEFVAAAEQVLEGVIDRLDVVEGTSRELLVLMRRRDDRERAAAIARSLEAERRFMEAEVAGAINVISQLSALAFNDPQLGKQIAGIYESANQAVGLFSSFATGGIGVFALTGGIGNLAMGLVGLFGPSNNELLIRRLDQIEKKIDALFEVIKKGFEHLDQRLTDIHDLSLEILRELIVGNTQLASRLTRLQNDLDRLSTIVRMNEAQSRDNALQEALLSAAIALHGGCTAAERTMRIRALAAAVSYSTGVVTQSPHTAWVAGEPLFRLADYTNAADGVSYQIGFLPLVASVAMVPAVSGTAQIQSHPNPDRWCDGVSAALELIALDEVTDSQYLGELLSDLWVQGVRLRNDILCVLHPDVIEHLVRRLEAQTLRDLTANHVLTLEARIDALARGPQVAPSQVVRDPLRKLGEALATSPDLFVAFEQLALSLRFTLALHGWRLAARSLAQPYRLLDAQLLCCRTEIVEFLGAAASRAAASFRSQGVDPAATDVWPRVVDALISEFRIRMSDDLARARTLAQSLRKAPSEERERVPSIDAVLAQVYGTAGALGRTLQTDIARKPPGLMRSREFESARTVDRGACQELLRTLAEASATEFESLLGDANGVKGEWRQIRPLTLSCRGTALVRGDRDNVDGRRSVARIDLPSPLNVEDGTEQFELYDEIIKETFGLLEWDARPPRHLVDHLRSGGRQSRVRNYFWAGTPFVALALSLTEDGAPAMVSLQHGDAPVVICDRSDTVLSLRLWVFTSASCGFTR